MTQSVRRHIVTSLLYVLLYLSLLLALLLFWSAYPKLLAQWSEKGTLFDFIGPTVLLVGAIASFGLAQHRRRRREAGTWRWLGYAVLLLVLAMEEIGWGFEVLSFARLEVAGIPVDSVHDLGRLSRRLGISSLSLLLQSSAVILAVGCAGVMLTASGRRLIRRVRPVVATLLVLGGFTLFCAAILDARIVDVFPFLRRNPPYALEEGLELLGEIMLVLVVFDGWAGRAAATVGPPLAQPVPSPGVTAAAVTASSDH